MLAADALNLLRGEALVHGAVAFPEDDARAADRFRRVSAKFLVRNPDAHLLERDAHPIPGVAPEALVGRNQDFFTPFECPFHDRGPGGTWPEHAPSIQPPDSAPPLHFT